MEDFVWNTVADAERFVFLIRKGEHLLFKDEALRFITFDMTRDSVKFKELARRRRPLFFLPRECNEGLNVDLDDGDDATHAGCFLDGLLLFLIFISLLDTFLELIV